VSTFRRIDYFRMHDSIKQRVNTHYDSVNVLVVCSRSEKLTASRKWTVDVHIPNLPMTMTFYGASKMAALVNADYLLQYFIKGPSTPRLP
jgi:hypothetical protein